jgi:hypothetical protein
LVSKTNVESKSFGSKNFPYNNGRVALESYNNESLIKSFRVGYYRSNFVYLAGIGAGANKGEVYSFLDSGNNIVAASPGTIGASQSICSGGDPATFTSTAPGVGDGVISYRWESSVSPFSVWTPIAGAGSETYDAPPGLTATTQYRRIAISIWSCNY